jgi:hypothetical protein
MNPLLIIGLGVAAYLLLTGTAAVRTAERLVVQYRRIRNARFSGLTTLEVELVMAVNNPTTNTLRLNAITGRIRYKGQVLATVNRTLGVDIRSLAEIEVGIPLRIDLVNALTLAKDYVGNRLDDLEIDLLFTAGVQQIPFTFRAPLAGTLPPLPTFVRSALSRFV